VLNRLPSFYNYEKAILYITIHKGTPTLKFYCKNR
jgi:hypothetical protein